ncbi:MAG: VOC family protein [Chloroflexi bacterium]|nr:VOC family protein [Chloroflexota bacterium]
MPKVSSLGHVGIYVHDLERSRLFYRDTLGLRINDEDLERGIVFMSAKDRAEEHHEFVLMRGREDGKVVQQISFHVDSLGELKEFFGVFRKQQVPINRVVSHGNAVGIYFQDPDGNQIEVYWPTGVDWPQPFGKPVDLTQPDAVVLASLT